MAPPRRVRDEALTLRKSGSPDIELFRARAMVYLDQYPTQGRFQVAPNAQAMAFTTPGKNTLSIVRRDGTSTAFERVYREQFRMSPDGLTLAFAQYDSGTLGMSHIDLRTMQQGFRATLSAAVWSEFSPEGLLVIEYNYAPSSRENRLLLLTRNEEPRVVARLDDHVRRFTCAKAGTSVAYFSRGKVFSVAQPGAEPVYLADLGEDVVNAEMSPDGQSLIVVTNTDAYLFEDGKPARALGIPDAHTVWFSHDGSQFVVANARMAHWQRGARTAKLTADENTPLRSARFAPRSPWVMVARGQDAVRWNPELDESETIASVDDNHEMLGVDVFGGGVVLWTGTTWQLEDRRYGRG